MLENNDTFWNDVLFHRVVLECSGENGDPQLVSLKMVIEIVRPCSTKDENFILHAPSYFFLGMQAKYFSR